MRNRGAAFRMGNASGFPVSQW